MRIYNSEEGVAKALFNNRWTFLKTDTGTGIDSVVARTSEFQPVEIPHDWLIYDTHGFYADAVGWYRRVIKAEELKADIAGGERVQIRFDGVYMNSTLYLNGREIAQWKYGYSTFDADLTEHLVQGDNELLLKVDFQAPNSRWYSGAGIYRNVWLKVTKKSFLPLDGTYVSISPLDQNDLTGGFAMDIETEIAGVREDSLGCRYSLLKDGAVVKELGFAGITDGEKAGPLPGYVCGKAHLKTETDSVKLWEIDDPACYELVVSLTDKDNNTIYDTQRITVGFCTKEFKAGDGFYLNGRKLKIHGVCEHHDLGCLGSAWNDAAMARKFKTLRAMGVNAIRTAHNMPAPELMELADRMGFLVMNEAFDMWERPKNKYDYARFFKDWAEKDVESWIRRDRNHPSLFLWSIGNEIYDTHADEYGQEITRRLIGFVRTHDPKNNAPITIGSNYMAWENARKCADIVKIAGYNYGEKYYAPHQEEHPDWVIYGSETASVVQSRGIYHFPMSQSILADEDEQCSSLGNSSTSWGAKSIEKDITDDRDADFTFGQFLWTGCDYIGEPTPYHTKNSYFGQIDTAGFPKDSFYAFQAEWTDFEKAPMVHLYPYWDFNEGQLIDVRACTNAPMVELLVNGVSQGVQKIDHEKGLVLSGNWQVPYTPGTITAIAYDESGKEVCRDVRTSFGESREVALSVDRPEIIADNRDLVFLTIETKDEQGNPVENASDYVTVKVEGPGRLLGLDNGDSTDYDAYKGCTRKLFSGKLLAVIGSTAQAGKITVTVSGEGLIPASVEIEALPAENAEEYDYLENLSGMPCESGANDPVPVRKIELATEGGAVITEDVPELLIEAKILPENASATDVVWKVVNDAGIEVGFASVEEIVSNGCRHVARVKAKGDGSFRVRCMGGGGRITVISQLECRAEDLGQVFLNPYELISAGLHAGLIGEVTNGNEKGIATSRTEKSGAYYEDIDFGEYGSDEITMPIFTLSNDAYPMEIWQGKPYAEGSSLITTVVYQKISKWNTYQEETWKLPVRLKGIQTIGFVLTNKAHIKGFVFKYTEKAYGRLFAGEADSVYGDSFERNGNAVEKIGNNVTLVYENMNFGEEGPDSITIKGRTPLTMNTIHVRFTPEGEETVNCIAEFKGEGSEYTEQTFPIEGFAGSGKVEVIFLPGSDFDLEAFVFEKK